MEGLFQGVAHAYASKLHGPAMWTLWREHGSPRVIANAMAKAMVAERAKRLPAPLWNAGAAAFSFAPLRP